MAENKIPDSEVQEEEEKKATIEDTIVDEGSAAIEDLKEHQIETKKKNNDEDEREDEAKDKDKNETTEDKTNDKDEVEKNKTDDKNEIEGTKTDDKNKIEGIKIDEIKIKEDKADDKIENNGKNKMTIKKIKDRDNLPEDLCFILSI